MACCDGYCGIICFLVGALVFWVLWWVYLVSGRVGCCICVDLLFRLSAQAVMCGSWFAAGW